MRTRLLVIALAVFAIVGVTLLPLPSGDVASAKQQGEVVEQFCEVIFQFNGSICPEDHHGSLNIPDDLVNSDDPNVALICFYQTDVFAPYLEPGHTIVAAGSALITPSGNMNLRCDIDVPDEWIAQEIPSTQIRENATWFAPVFGVTENTHQHLTPAGTIKVTAHFQYAD